ncbi:hypothetical protein [Paenibacillus sp. sgz302251]|uniref:hypothetical protein n=1 Tax=Paenibacillus sp. sgz302251 TaxID=3414493 RepID=UPI003C7B00A8
MLSLGIDISSISEAKSALALSRLNGEKIEVVLLSSLPDEGQAKPIARKISGKNNKDLTAIDYANATKNVIDEWLKCIQNDFNWDIEKPINWCVDTPIDISELVSIFSLSPNEIYNHMIDKSYGLLKRRYIDQYTNGLSSIGERIGHVWVRFRSLWAVSPEYKVGDNLFETYPRGSLRELLKIPTLSSLNQVGYDGKIDWDINQWCKGQDGSDLLLQNTLLCGLQGMQDTSFTFTDDDFDAIISSLAGLGIDIMDELNQFQKEGAYLPCELPLGYRLVKNNYWNSIVILRKYELNKGNTPAFS